MSGFGVVFIGLAVLYAQPLHAYVALLSIDLYDNLILADNLSFPMFVIFINPHTYNTFAIKGVG